MHAHLVDREAVRDELVGDALDGERLPGGQAIARRDLLHEHIRDLRAAVEAQCRALAVFVVDLQSRGRCRGSELHLRIASDERLEGGEREPLRLDRDIGTPEALTDGARRLDFSARLERQGALDPRRVCTLAVETFERGGTHDEVVVEGWLGSAITDRNREALQREVPHRIAPPLACGFGLFPQNFEPALNGAGARRRDHVEEADGPGRAARNRRLTVAHEDALRSHGARRRVEPTVAQGQSICARDGWAAAWICHRNILQGELQRVDLRARRSAAGGEREPEIGACPGHIDGEQRRPAPVGVTQRDLLDAHGIDARVPGGGVDCLLACVLGE